MLVLTRRVSESIRIGDDVIVKVLGFDRGNISIGIEAPLTTNICRTEIIDRKEKEKDND